MHIKSVIIDGFKSYGKRVELKDFDPEFNAITGLNGTGKSNILDAICFTLGISAMNTIRASSMQDVIYKNGQAGVHTATVTIKFDNKDKARSAPHYKGNDEIVISREVGMNSKNIYKINGITVQAKRIMDFFNSLQMNVNNPHFIIMQGRITKVLNMKPIEILSMIEEAAGTHMYESKKKNLELTVIRKENKLREMRTIAEEEIMPTIKTIENEKQMLEELNMVQGQLKTQQEKLDNWNYVTLTRDVENITKKLNDLNQTIDTKNAHKLSLENQIEEINETLKVKDSEIEKEVKKKINKLETEIEQMENNKNKIQLEIAGCKKNITIELKKMKDIEKQIIKSKKCCDIKNKEMEDFNELHAGLDEENKKYTNDLDEIDKKIVALNSGNIFTEENDGSVQENINKFKLELQNQSTENQQCTLKVDGLKKTLNEQLIGMKEAQKAYDMQMVQLTAKEKDYDKIKNEYLKANEELSQRNNLTSSCDSLRREICNLESALKSFESRNPNLFFNFNDPRPNFNRNNVHGLICRLFKPIDFRFELALTLIAGGKLYYVVVEDDTIGKDILETNKFRNRMNFIPLSKIKSDSMPPNVVRTAQQIGGVDQVFPAMSLIKYDKKHLKAIQWIFGQSFICTTKEIAEKVCFDNRVNRNCYTLEGDHFNPSGSLTGGSNNQRLFLKALAEQDEIKLQLEAKKSEIAKLNNRLTTMDHLSDKIAELSDQQNIVQAELDKIKSDVHLGKPHQQVTEVNSIKQQIVELENKLAEGKANEKQLKAKIKDLETQMKNAKNILKQQLNDAEKTRNNILAMIRNSKDEYDKRKTNYAKLELDITELKNQIKDEENQLTELNVEKCKIDEQLIEYMSRLEAISVSCEKIKTELNCHYEIYNAGNKEMDNLKIKRKRMQEEAHMIDVRHIDLVAKQKNLEQALEKVEEDLGHLKKRFSAIQKEMALKMDFNNFDSEESTIAVSNLRARYKELSKVVDPGKLNNFHKYIQEYQILQKKMDTIVRDKNKIVEIIEELEVKKHQHLKRASDRVNIEFGKIFNSVLPGAQASLRQLNKNDITAGLEIRVAFNGLWKDSLDELSGGQRSLVALSLVLAMLLFNPVPLYILDEVDAALDLSHTQNIGKMLKQHFKQSQFIVVSLKDGMFSNANVLFRTKFVDGSSAVTRTTCNNN
ncbi:Structural maintenance of chromosomes protein,SMCs flexible hinge,P-loop containing nucleoside [Cinara cedri]|uniref:Structural maintenance of chromosomes protein,SMCs flexible hinge,P-loop containing nucleoside n=1 Tax=Cinara cedri TaxID=506608 RepID=A0A5E4MEN1_9HEMI|nr:Structural maintenance of chromosomes protein,SMCs flexible hinge,P-loop containing nucleoside [Cinara cedri]